MQTIPSVDIYRNKATEAFALLNFVADPQWGWNVATGDLVQISPERMRIEGLTVVLNSLAEFKTRTYVRSELDRIPAPQSQSFERRHDLVSVRMPSKTELIVDRLFPGREGGHKGRNDGGISVKLPCDNPTFYAKLSEAFEVCARGSAERVSRIESRTGPGSDS